MRAHTPTSSRAWVGSLIGVAWRRVESDGVCDSRRGRRAGGRVARRDEGVSAWQHTDHTAQDSSAERCTHMHARL